MFLAVLVLNGCQEPQSPRSQVYEYMRNLTADDYESVLKVMADTINEDNRAVNGEYEVANDGGKYVFQDSSSGEEYSFSIEVKDYSFDNSMQEGVITLRGVMHEESDLFGVDDYKADFMVSFAFDDGRFFLEKVMRVDIDNFESGGELINHRDAPWIEDLLGKLIEF